MLPSATTNDQSSKTQSQDILSYNLSNAEKAQQQLTTMVRDQAVYELTRIETIERNHHGLKASIRQSRNQRGLFDGGGKILNWLFDVSTTEELDKVNNQVAKLSTETTAIVNALETHATLINETMWELHASKEATDALQRSCLTLNKELNNAKRTINNLSREINGETERRSSKQRYGKNLPRPIFHSTTEIKTKLPTGWALTPATQAGDMWKSYQEATVTAAAIENGIRLFIHIPIFEFTRALTLYRVIGMARATKNGSTSLKYVGLPQYLATSPDH
ncbi:Uncharacterized protein APZ42_027719 [Daphnia magna]|uniref:Uncharacterized protein n=1 Tax=Daphnia magna TaxID=35525 RepID=A0A164R4B6_9CRUS|nr:Uncharacterized protein APZ42_027719 [Daphnia magna]